MQAAFPRFLGLRKRIQLLSIPICRPTAQVPHRSYRAIGRSDGGSDHLTWTAFLSAYAYLLWWFDDQPEPYVRADAEWVMFFCQCTVG